MQPYNQAPNNQGPPRHPQQQGQMNYQQPRQGQGPPRGPGQPGQQGGGFLDFNQISSAPSKYPREELPENLEENMELGGAYQEFVYKLGDCCGNIAAICQCCCCCV